jgi:ferredoxin--NADP+ reductase
MFPILAKRLIAPNVWRYTLRAPEIAAKRLPGNFVILRPVPGSERIPLTIVTTDLTAGSLDIIFQVVGATTLQLSRLETGAEVADVVGPLGHPTHLEGYGTTVMVGGGVGIAPLLPIAEGFRAQGNRLITILGARSKDFLILEEELAAISARLLIATEDGSKGVKGLVTHVLKDLCGEEPVHFVMAAGPVPMMQAVAELTRPLGIRTMVSLNPLMIDGTGMCGVCRCRVDGKTKFACVDGPEFDAHQVDFASLRRRLGMFRTEEKTRMEAMQNHAS